jgi:hypothetical protein
MRRRCSICEIAGLRDVLFREVREVEVAWIRGEDERLERRQSDDGGASADELS